MGSEGKGGFRGEGWGQRGRVGSEGKGGVRGEGWGRKGGVRGEEWGQRGRVGSEGSGKRLLDRNYFDAILNGLGTFGNTKHYVHIFPLK